MEYVNYNGRLYPKEEKLITGSSRGLRFGDGVFETMKSKNREIYFAQQHVDRLLQGLDTLQFKKPPHFDKYKLVHQCQILMKKNGHNGMARIRFTAFRGDGGLYDEISHTPHYIIESWALPDDAGKWNSNGLVLGIYADVNKSCDAVANLKHNNFLPYVMGALHAKKERWNDAIILNNCGNVSDTTIANIFLVKDEKIYTPALNQGCVAGIMRSVIINKLQEQNLKVIETEITEAAILEADEVFLSNSIYNIRWVQSMGDASYGNQFIQKIYALLAPTIL